MYSIRGSLDLGYYLQTWSTMIRLISCLPDSNKNSEGEFVKVSGNWLNGELTCPTSPRQIGQYLLLPTPNPIATCSLPVIYLYIWTTPNSDYNLIILLEYIWIMLGIYVNIELANLLTKRTLLVIGYIYDVFNTSRNKVSSSSVKAIQVCPRIKWRSAGF